MDVWSDEKVTIRAKNIAQELHRRLCRFMVLIQIGNHLHERVKRPFHVVEVAGLGPPTFK
ncbi:hypothetical protein Ahy_A04g021649 isoform F [Arachis hypogaea]|uniref:Uncharacterized protein n=1 Tax=Arachis hypogaea TaxID=3818 RepID=A0A445DL02_ARAHY|nr:hypothetical protein Ahy_A04g021649 isoform F [Arachis hypogaea]